MARGGARSGAGRKPGSATKKTREIADKAAESGLTPLEVMLRAMQEHVDAGQWDKAAQVAKDAAPYVHPRLTAVEHTGPNGGPLQHKHQVDLSALSDEELDALERTLAKCSASAAGPPGAG